MQPRPRRQQIVRRTATLLAVLGIILATVVGVGGSSPASADGTLGSSSFWLVMPAGAVYSFGHAPFYGSPGGSALARPLVGMTITPDGKGYWLVGSDGGIFAYGAAAFFGSTGAINLNRPIVGMATTPDGKGYWLVASDGGIFAFGDAAFFGSTGAITLNQPIVGMAATPDGKGYWLLASDGGIFAFGDAAFFGSTGGSSTEPAEKVVSTKSGAGYWVIDQNGTAYGFGNAQGTTAPSQGLLFRLLTPGDRAVLFAFAQLGKPYIWGGNGPVGYDCSGLALASWTSATGVGFARVANDQYHTAGTSVALTSLQTGDLIFWGSNQADWTSVYHVSIYIGGDNVIDATGDHVQLGSVGQWTTAGDLMPNGRRP